MIMDLQLLEQAAKHDGLSCNDFSTSFQQTIYTCYSFTLFSTEEHQSLRLEASLGKQGQK